MSLKISVIIPTYNEEKVIHGTLEDLFMRHSPDEVIVVDGGSQDKTVSIAREWAKVIRSVKGRAQQMNTGASLATGDIFLFLHADTKLPSTGILKIREAVQKGALSGRFRMRFDERRRLFRFYESYTRFQFFSYGDQAFFVQKEIFKLLGGYRGDVPFEDIDFYQRLRRITKPVILKEAVVTSARRFSQVGCLRQKFINIFLVSLYRIGLDVFQTKEKLYPEIR